MLRGQNPGIAENLEPLSDYLGEAVQDLGQVASRATLDSDRRTEEAHVLGRYAGLEAEERFGRVAAQPDLVVHLSEFRPGWVGHLLADQLDRPAERIAGPNGTADHVEPIGKLRLEAGETTGAFVHEDDGRNRAGGQSGQQAPEKGPGADPRAGATYRRTGEREEHQIRSG